MRTKNLLFAMLMAPALITACSNEEFMEQAAQNAETIPGKDVTLVFQGNPDTRMDYRPGTELGEDVWTSASYRWELPSGSSFSFDNAVDRIGVSRLSGGMATTNYLFYPTAVISAGQNNWVESGPATGTGARFSTKHQTIFTGDYVAYYPYSGDLISDGPVTLTLKQAQVQDSSDPTAHVAENGFAISDVFELEGGEQVDRDFTLQQLYGTLYFRLNGNVSNFLSVSLESDEAIFPIEATLDVSKLQSKSAADLTAEDLTVTEKVNHIDLTLDAAKDLQSAPNYDMFYMMLMPGTYTNARIVYRTTMGYYTEALGSFTVTPGTFMDVTRPLEGSSFNPYSTTDNIIVNDAASWASALQAVATVSNTTRVISVNAPITLDGTLFASNVDASKTGKVIVRGEKITVKNSVGTGVFQNVVFENEVSIHKDVTSISIPDGSNVTFENLDADNANTNSTLSIGVGSTSGAVLNLKNANVKGGLSVNSDNDGELNIIEGGILTTDGEVAIGSNNILHVEKGATWNFADGELTANNGALNVEGALNINDGSFIFNDKCNFTNGTVTINGGEVNVAAALANFTSGPGNVRGTITNVGGVVTVANTLAANDGWARDRSTSIFTNNGGEYYVLGLTDPSALATTRQFYAQATGFEFNSSWTVTDANQSYDYDILLNATTNAITVTIRDNATCTVDGDLIINGTTNAVTITKGTGSNLSRFNVNNVTVNAGGELKVGDAANDSDFQMNCSSCYVYSTGKFSWASNVTGCVPSGDGQINQ